MHWNMRLTLCGQKFNGSGAGVGLMKTCNFRNVVIGANINNKQSVPVNGLCVS